jgi:ribosome maturation factor RimP
MNRESLNKIVDLVSRVVNPLGYECLDVEWVAHDRILRVFVDSLSGVGMDDCLRVNRELVELEELDENVPGSYRLEVSSPGVEKPLRTAAHFSAVIGQNVRVKLTQSVDDRRQGAGRVLDVDAEKNVTLGLDSGEWRFPVTLVHGAKLVYEWN